ncbi:unnamed protein product, partial [Nezara viridula]
MISRIERVRNVTIRERFEIKIPKIIVAWEAEGRRRRGRSQLDGRTEWWRVW